MVSIKLKYNFGETPRKFIIAELSIRTLGPSSVLTIIIISTDEDPSLRIYLNCKYLKTSMTSYIRNLAMSLEKFPRK